MKFGRWQMERFRLPRLESLAVWDMNLATELDGDEPDEPAWLRIGSPRVEALRRSGRSDAAIADEIAGDVVRALLRIHEGKVGAGKGFDAAVLTGSKLELAGMRAALEAHALPFRLVIADHAHACLEAGARRLLASVDADPNGVVIDVGNAAVRAIALGDATIRPVLQRNFERVPLAEGDRPKSIPPSQVPSLVDRSGDLVGRALVSLLSRTSTVAASMILALPCTVDETGVPGPSSYPGWTGNEALLETLVARADTHLSEHVPAWPASAVVRVWVLSHAELVALASEDLVDAPTPNGTLALTLGYGPGAALLRGGP